MGWNKSHRNEKSGYYGGEVKIMLMEGAKLPQRSTSGSAGYDIYAYEDVELMPGKNTMLRTGFRLAIPAGFYAGILSRSGLCSNFYIRVAAGENIIDSDYRGEVMVVLENYGEYPYTIHKGDRIAQMVFQRYGNMDFDVVDFLPATGRANGGFGSTGR